MKNGGITAGLATIQVQHDELTGANNCFKSNSIILRQYREADPNGLGKLCDTELAKAIYEASKSKQPYDWFLWDIGVGTKPKE